MISCCHRCRSFRTARHLPTRPPTCNSTLQTQLFPPLPFDPADHLAARVLKMQHDMRWALTQLERVTTRSVVQRGELKDLKSALRQGGAGGGEGGSGGTAPVPEGWDRFGHPDHWQGDHYVGDPAHPRSPARVRGDQLDTDARERYFLEEGVVAEDEPHYLPTIGYYSSPDRTRAAGTDYDD